MAPRSVRSCVSGYRGTRLRRVGIHLFAGLVSLMVGQRVTDTTSGFRAVNRKGIRLFAADYPHDYPEVEATVLAAKAGLRRAEVPVEMRERSAGRSSIGAVRSVYYMVKVMLAIFLAVFRREQPCRQRRVADAPAGIDAWAQDETKIVDGCAASAARAFRECDEPNVLGDIRFC